jgi:hypothetical protein
MGFMTSLDRIRLGFGLSGICNRRLFEGCGGGGGMDGDGDGDGMCI